MKGLNLNSWMSGIDGDRRLFCLNLVGTHDCVTQYVQLSHFAKCQSMNIYDQLCIGVRALDIRVQARGSRLKMVHGITKAFTTANHFSAQMDMEYVLDCCYKFLNEHKSETIIFQFKNDSGKEQEKCFDNLYGTYISKNPDKWYLKNCSPTLDEVRGKIVLIRRCKKDEGKYAGADTGVDFSKWVEQTQLVPDPLELEAGSMTFIVQDRFKYKPKPRWNDVIKPFLDSMTEFNGKYIVNYLSTAGGLKGPKGNAKYINRMFDDYSLDSKRYYGTIYMDFPTEKLVEKVISTNFDTNII